MEDVQADIYIYQVVDRFAAAVAEVRWSWARSRSRGVPRIKRGRCRDDATCPGSRVAARRTRRYSYTHSYRRGRGTHALTLTRGAGTGFSLGDATPAAARARGVLAGFYATTAPVEEVSLLSSATDGGNTTTLLVSSSPSLPVCFAPLRTLSRHLRHRRLLLLLLLLVAVHVQACALRS